MRAISGGFWVNEVTALACVASVALLWGPRARAEPPRVAPVVEAERRLPLANWKSGVDNLRLLDLQGRDITERFDPREQDGRVTLRVADTTPFIAKPRRVEAVELSDAQRAVLPGGFVVPLPQGSSGATGAALGVKLVWFRITASASPLPAPWDERVEAYTTALSVGLKAPADAPEGLKPPTGVPVKLLFDGASAADIPPLSLEEPGIDHERSVALQFRPSGPSSQLLLRSSISDVNIELRALPRLAVRPTSSEVLGLGLETVEVNVERIAPHGAGLVVSDNVPVLLQVDSRARLEPSTPRIAAGESRTVFTLRSSGVGALHIQANAGGQSGTATIERRFPVGPLVGVLVGGGLGGFARRFVKGARRSAHRRRILEGLSVSLVAFVAGVFGINSIEALPAELVATEAGAFLVGALSGFTGVSVLEWLSRRKAPVRVRAAA